MRKEHKQTNLNSLFSNNFFVNNYSLINYPATTPAPPTTTPVTTTTTVTEPPADLITCDFEKDFCQWISKSEDEKYYWFRNTSSALESSGIKGTVYIVG
jgi:hypothetical protein